MADSGRVEHLPDAELKIGVDSYVQESVAGTNGRMYRALINRLRRYPIPDCPLPAGRGELLLDIGCGWGRWMVSAGRGGYVPVGIDVKLDALQATRRVLRDHGLGGYVVAADLKSLPFQSGTFDVVFSYSTIQHAHRQSAYLCVEEVHRVLAPSGLCMLELPNRHGVGNVLRSRPCRAVEEDDPESWCVRYYTLAELEELFLRVFGNFSYTADCYFGTGVQRSDLDMLPWRYKGIVLCSELLRYFSRRWRVVKKLADSIYVYATKSPLAAARPHEAPSS